MKLLNSRGLVSLPTVTIASLFFLMLTLAMTKMMVGELRQSTDSENSVRAYYVANSAAEEAVMKIKTGPPTPTTCTDAPVYNVAGVTCTSYDPTAKDNISGTWDVGKVYTYYIPEGVGGINMDISWDDPNKNPVNALPSASNPSTWTGPPPLDVRVVSFYKADPTVTIYSLALLWPLSTAAASPTMPWPGVTTALRNVKCNNASSYRCDLTLININQGNAGAVLEISPRYADTNFRLKSQGNKVFTAAENPLDITAKVGDSYRRISQNITNSTGAKGFTDVIHGDSGVCKQLLQSQDPSGYNSVVNGSYGPC